MKLMRRTLFAGLFLLSMRLHAQPPAQAKVPSRPVYYPAHLVSPELRRVADALGDRVQKPSNELVTMVGTLNRSGAVSNLQVSRQLPNLFRIDESGPNNRSLGRNQDGFSGSTAITPGDEDLAESFDNDTAEALLGTFSSRLPMRHLGDRFRVTGVTGFGASVNIFETVAAVAFKSDKTPQRKVYHFDSDTGLLARVIYSTVQAGKRVTVQTIYSNYSAVNGYPLPGRIARQVNGVEVFSFTRTTATVSAAAPANAFAAGGR